MYFLVEYVKTSLLCGMFSGFLMCDVRILCSVCLLCRFCIMFYILEFQLLVNMLAVILAVAIG